MTKKKIEEIDSENINGTLHPDEFYLSYSRLQYIYKSDSFKELKYFLITQKELHLIFNASRIWSFTM